MTSKITLRIFINKMIGYILYIYICLYIYIYIYNKEATPHSAGPWQGGFEVLGGSLLDSIWGCFGLQVGGLG